MSAENNNTRESCRTYLLTYSQADKKIVPSKESFADIILNGFSTGNSKVVVEHWAVCVEPHAVGGGKHYHMSLKLSGTRRWRAVHHYIYRCYKISVNFSTNTCGYLAAYRYVCKEKEYRDVLHSNPHPNLREAASPPAKKAFKAYSEAARTRRLSQEQQRSEGEVSTPAPKPAKRQRLTDTNVTKFVIENNIKSATELMAVANEREGEGQDDLFDFVVKKKSEKNIEDFVTLAWKISSAPKERERSQNVDRLALVIQRQKENCADGCNGEWFACAREVLRNNSINAYVYADALRQCLDKGRKKNNNILLVGPTNCGKSFLLNPVELLFRKCFANPATGRYAWVGLDECDVAYLNDLRWSSELIVWNDFLLLLEGQTVHLPRPKNMFATDMLITRENTLPILSTSKDAIEYIGKYNVRDQKETDMMSTRWKMFTFTHQIEQANIKDIAPCVRCFCTLVIHGMDE